MSAHPKSVDWLSIEGEYRAGTAALRDIAGRHGITEGTIRARAKKHGWTRDAAKTKRTIVAARMAGITQEVAQNVMRNIEAAAADDVADMERGLRINRNCLMALESAAETVAEPRDVKVIVEATSAAIESIRRIRGLDEQPGGKEADADDESRAMAIAERLEAGIAERASERAAA